jgi:hypothetical protein
MAPDSLRDHFCVSGAKDDRRDAYVAADGLRTDRHLFRRLHVADPGSSSYVSGRGLPKSSSKKG